MLFLRSNYFQREAELGLGTNRKLTEFPSPNALGADFNGKSVVFPGPAIHISPTAIGGAAHVSSFLSPFGFSYCFR